MNLKPRPQIIFSEVYMNISILGAGTWGVALAKILSRKHNVSV